MPTLPTHQPLVNFLSLSKEGYTNTSPWHAPACCCYNTVVKQSQQRYGNCHSQNQQVENRPSLECCYYSNCQNSQDDNMHNPLQTLGIQATDYSGMSVSSSDYVTSNESYAK